MRAKYKARLAAPLLAAVLLSGGACTDTPAEPAEFVPPDEIWPGMTIRVERDPCPGEVYRALWFRWTEAVGEPPPVFSTGPLPAETFVVTDLIVPAEVDRGIAEFTLVCRRDQMAPHSYLLEWTAEILSEPPAADE